MRRFLTILIGLMMFLGAISIVLSYSLFVYILGWILWSKEIRLYSFNTAYSIDQFGNVLLLGDPDETISSRLGRAMASGRPILFARCLTWIVNKIFRLIAKQKNHVLESIEDDEKCERELWSWIK